MWKQAFRQEVSRPVDFFGIICKLGLNRVGGQQHGRLWWTVNFVAQDALLHLKEEQLLGDVLDQLLRHILWEELGPKLKLQRVLLLHILGRHLEKNYNIISIKGIETDWKQGKTPSLALLRGTKNWITTL